MKAVFASLALAATLLATPAFAGRSCEAPTPPKAAMIEKGMALAARTAQALEAEFQKNGARVVVLARAGQDLSKYNLRYSHLGWAYRDTSAETPRWLVLHKLNTCGTAVADVYRQGLGEFFLDDLWRFEAAWVVPTAELQDKLYPLLTNNARAGQMHVKPYSMVSYVWSDRYQQSNQWAMETLGLAMGGSTRRTDAQAWLKQAGYTPTELNIPPLTRLGGRVTQANVAFDDHPSKLRFSDRIQSVTVDSIFDWMTRSGLSGTVQTLRL